MVQLTGDEAVFYYRSNGKTEGAIVLHVDDIFAFGSKPFFDKVVLKIKNAFKLSKIEKN